MISKFKISLILLLLSSSLYSNENVKYISQVKMGFAFINSAGLNKITEGLNTSYGTSFGKIRVPADISGAFYIGLYRSRVGVELGYEYANRSSTSSLYGIDETVNYSAVPVSLNYQYSLLDTGRFELLAGAFIGFMNVSLSMSTDPMIVEEQAYKMVATAPMWGCGLDLNTRISKYFKFSSSLYYRNASTEEFLYSGVSLRHNNGDKVRFSDGSALTMDLSGIKFLLGIIFEWS